MPCGSRGGSLQGGRNREIDRPQGQADTVRQLPLDDAVLLVGLGDLILAVALLQGVAVSVEECPRDVVIVALVQVIVPVILGRFLAELEGDIVEFPAPRDGAEGDVGK